MRPANWAFAVITAILLMASTAVAQDRGTQDQAKALVEKASAHFKDTAPEKAFADFNDPKGEYQPNGLFVVVYDHDGKIVCTPGLPVLLNRDAKILKDVDGKEFGKEILAAPDGSWVDYRMTNPVTKKIEKKTSYVVHIGDYTLFVGAYST